ncbi:MAG TPA: tetratricopeptide repeat protein [Verrucomicrobiae bacterium]|jgi:TolA-binding protein|nr:tetratricopeptide repeat protein [Verrucomicrobiae bacterium]
MESDAKQSSMDIFQLVAWAQANRKQLIGVAIAIAVIGLGIGLYIWHGNARDASANDALAAIKPAARMPGVAPLMPPPDAYLKVANDYPGTPSGARALLMAAAGLFEDGKFKDAEALFTRFMQDYPEFPLSTQAQIGIAASLEAQGKTNEAATHYKEFRERHPSDSSWTQATSALARLYNEQGKPDQALKLYQELVNKRNNDTWSQEAPFLMHEILEKHPELQPKPTPPPAPAATQLMMPPTTPSTLTVTGTNSGRAPQLTTNRPSLAIPPPTGQSPGAPGSGVPLMITNKP